MRIVIVGAGGHGQVVCDLLQRAGPIAGTPVGFVDDLETSGKNILGIPVRGKVSELDAIPHDAVVVAIGDNGRRLEIADRLESLGERLVSVVHPTAIVASDVSIGDGTMICAGAVINTGSLLGRAVIVNTGATVDHHSVLADGVHIAPGVHMGGEVSIGAATLIGIGSVVLPGVKVGRRAIVGAGAVVTRNVPDHVTVVGSPAKPLRARTV